MNRFIAFFSAVIITSNAFSANSAQDLCSTEGLMRLVPQLKNKEGKFQIPDPVRDPKKFLDVHTSLTNIIEIAMAQANITANPYQISGQGNTPLKFSSAWRSAEVGIQTNGQEVSFPDGNHFASYGGVSFMSGITLLKQGADYYYSINKPDHSIPALVYVQPRIASEITSYFRNSL